MSSHTTGETLAARHARLFDRTNKRNVSEQVGRIAVSVLVVASIFVSLYFLAS